MAKLYFYYSTMNAGKSTLLLQSAYNYQERGMNTLLFTPAIDVRYGKGTIASRIGLTANAINFTEEFNFFTFVQTQLQNDPILRCVLVDEAQFLTPSQVKELACIVDELNLPVLAYGLRSDFQGNAFPGSLALLIYADNLVELKTVCHCGKKAIMSARIDAEGNRITSGAQVLIGGNEHYIALCRKHFNLSDVGKMT